MKRTTLCFGSVFFMLVLSGSIQAGDIGFIEDFAIADDRASALKQLIPGTDEYYFYHCLYYQHIGKFDQVDQMLKPWIERYGYTVKTDEIKNRQALLTYGKNAGDSLARITDVLKLEFQHQKRQLKPESHHPTTLDQKLISFETLTQRALAHKENLADFENSALGLLLGLNLDPVRRRDLLSRLERPDHPGLPRMVIDDLDYEHSGGFGSLPIHGKLLTAQLDECLIMKPDLISETAFINAYLTKLHPGADSDWRNTPAEEEAYLERMWAFAARLPPSQNSLKTHILYRRLLFDRGQGRYDKTRFAEYLKLPRDAHYVNPSYMSRDENRNNPARLAADFAAVTLLDPVGTDEALVRDYLDRFLAEAEDWKEFAPYVEEQYLRELFAETKILRGLGDMEKWYSLLPADKYRALKERVDLEFVPANKRVFRTEDDVALDIAIKNVPTLIIRTYRINTANYYQDHEKDIPSDIDLEGLVANEETTGKYDHVPLRRHTERFTFKNLSKPGVYVIDFIGNGQTCRAVIRKGRLDFTERMGSAGHVFRIYDENGRCLKNASLRLSGHEYKPDERGEIVVPFSNEPRTQKIVLEHDGFAQGAVFSHKSEAYCLSGGIYVDRESLIEGRSATALIRPALCLNRMPVDISLLEEPVLRIVSTDLDGVMSSKDVRNLVLRNDRETVYEFKVPKRLNRIHFMLRGKVQNLSRNEKEDVSLENTFFANAMDKTAETRALYLRHFAGSYMLEVLGKTGEPIASAPVHLSLKHRDFKESVDVTLQTDTNGRVMLGAMKDIAMVLARTDVLKNWQALWTPLDYAHSFDHPIHVVQGEPVRVPCGDDSGRAPGEICSLLELRENSFAADRIDCVTREDGFLLIRNLAPGDYSLFLKRDSRDIPIRVTAGRREAGQCLGQSRYLEGSPMNPIQIAKLEKTKANRLSIGLANSSATARVHVFATRFLPAYHVSEELGEFPYPSPGLKNVPVSLTDYSSGMTISDECRYVLERQYAAKFPGNMLKRPSLILNPWSPRESDEISPYEPIVMKGVYGSRSPGARGSALGRYAGRASGPAEKGSQTMGFLLTPSLVLANLEPDKNGAVEIELGTFGTRQQIHVLAIDQHHSAYREFSLPFTEEPFADLRLAEPLDPSSHLTEANNVTPLARGQSFTLTDLRTSAMEVYDSLPAVYRLYTTLGGNPALAEFAFVPEWPALEPARKKELYSKYACHELAFFIYKKDRPFFDSVVSPHLANKKDKTFMDCWLLGEKMDRYLDPWEHSRLNIVEQILLADRIEAERSVVRRHAADLNDLIAPDIEYLDRLFLTALQGSALETTDRLGYVAALKSAAPDAGKNETAMAPNAAMAPAAVLEAGGQADSAELEILEEPSEIEMEGDASIVGYELKSDAESRKEMRQFYKRLGVTMEWAEQNYYKRPVGEQTGGLITVNDFWRDYAARKPDAPFISGHLAQASHSFTEMMLAMAVLDLPFKAPSHKTEPGKDKLVFTPADHAVVFHRETRKSEPADGQPAVLVSQNFFAEEERYRYEGNEKVDKFVTEEFLTQRAYGCLVVLTNPSSSRRKVDVLLQVPEGAMPVKGSFATRSVHPAMEPYSTSTIEYYFYFPKPGKYRHYPVHVSEAGRLIGFAAPFEFNVTDTPTRFDRHSWAYISQHGSDSDVVRFLNDNNTGRLDLGEIAFRMRDPDFFRTVTALLRKRHVYHDVLWSYGLHHNDVPAIREYLARSPFADACGMAVDSPLLTVDPVTRHGYEHLEYWPLVNPRVHRIGKVRRIDNSDFFRQYTQFMTFLCYRPVLSASDQMAVVCYLLLQDRVEEAMSRFEKIARDSVDTAIQYDYFNAYLAFCRGKPDEARAIATAYKDYGVDRWRNLFGEILAQADEIAGAAATVVDKEDTQQRNTELADTEAVLDVAVENRKISIHHKNLTSCRINFYLADIEMRFSLDPFDIRSSESAAIVEPNGSMEQTLTEGESTATLDLPEQYRDRNVTVEVVGGGQRRTQTCYPNSLNVRLQERYGQVQVMDAASGEKLSMVYVKVYARLPDGQIRFYKDGYTDLRGRFDYASLNTEDLSDVEEFSILILSDTRGSVVKQAKPPKM